MEQFETGGPKTPIDFTLCKHKGTYEYTSKNAGFNYVFDVNNDAGEWRAYITNGPTNYKGRDTGGHPTHRLVDKENNKMYVCTDPNNKPVNAEETLSWAVMWAEFTDDYIKTGKGRQVRP